MKEQVVNGYIPGDKWKYWHVQRDLKTDKMPLWYRILLKEETKNTLFPQMQFMLSIIRVIWVDRHNKKNRNDAAEKTCNLLDAGKSVIYFPEGTWNLHPSKPMLPMYWGGIDRVCEGSIRPPAGADHQGVREEDQQGTEAPQGA